MPKHSSARPSSTKVEQLDIGSVTQSAARRLESTKQGGILRAGKVVAAMTSGEEPAQANAIILAIELGDLDGAKHLLFAMTSGGFFWSLWAERCRSVIQKLEAIP